MERQNLEVSCKAKTVRKKPGFASNENPLGAGVRYWAQLAKSDSDVKTVAGRQDETVTELQAGAGQRDSPTGMAFL